MTVHSVMIPTQIASQNIDAYNRSAVTAATDVSNGNLVKLTVKSTTAGEGEVWTAVTPSTSAGLTNVWVVYQGDEIVVTNNQYKGLDPDPRNFYVPATKVFSVFKPVLGDLITITDDGLGGTYSAGVTTHVNATDGATGGLIPVWGNSQTGSVFSMKLNKVTYISLATGAIDSQRVRAFEFEVVGL
jgi:hypothetical protein